MDITTPATLQMRADLAELRDIVTTETDGSEPDETGSRKAVEGNLELTRVPGEFSVHVTDDVPGEPGDLQDMSSFVMYLVFSSTLEVRQASITVMDAKGGGFARPIAESALGGFVTGVLAGVVSELAVSNQ